MIKKPYPPGPKGKRHKGRPSEYARELREKQKLKNWYNLQETQFRNYVKEALSKRGRGEDSGTSLIRKLEFRLDNVVFKLGFASSRTKARQLVSHGYFRVNGRACNIPSRVLKKGDVVSVKPEKINKKVIKEVKELIKNYKTQSWLELDKGKLEGKITEEPSMEEVSPSIDMSAIFEFYSR